MQRNRPIGDLFAQKLIQFITKVEKIELERKQLNLRTELSSLDQNEIIGLLNEAKTKSQFSNHLQYSQNGLALVAKFAFKIAQHYFQVSQDFQETIAKNYVNKKKSIDEHRMQYPHFLEYTNKFNNNVGIFEIIVNALDMAKIYSEASHFVSPKQVELNELDKEVDQLFQNFDAIRNNSEMGIIDHDDLPSPGSKPASSAPKDSKDAKEENPLDGQRISDAEIEKLIQQGKEKRKTGELDYGLTELDPAKRQLWLKRKVLTLHTNIQLNKMIEEGEIEEDDVLHYETQYRARLAALIALDKSAAHVFGKQLSKLSNEIDAIIKKEETLLDEIKTLKLQLDEDFSEADSDSLKAKQSELHGLVEKRKVLRAEFENIKEEILNKISEKDLIEQSQEFHRQLRVADDITAKMVKSAESHFEKIEKKAQKDKKRKAAPEPSRSESSRAAKKPKPQEQKDEKKNETSLGQFAKKIPLNRTAREINDNIASSDDFRKFIHDILTGQEVSFTLILNPWQNIVSNDCLARNTLILLQEKSITKEMGYGLTPILAAALSNQVRKTTIDELINSGADVNKVLDSKHNPYDGFNALMLASYHGNKPMVEALLAKEVNPSLAIEANPYFTNWTALELACAGGHIEIVKLLLDHQVRCDVKEKDQYLWEIALEDTNVKQAASIKNLIKSHPTFLAATTKTVPEDKVESPEASKAMEDVIEKGPKQEDVRMVPSSAPVSEPAPSLNLNKPERKRVTDQKKQTYDKQSRPTTGGLRLKKKSPMFDPELALDLTDDEESEQTETAGLGMPLGKKPKQAAKSGDSVSSPIDLTNSPSPAAGSARAKSPLKPKGAPLSQIPSPEFRQTHYPSFLDSLEKSRRQPQHASLPQPSLRMRPQPAYSDGVPPVGFQAFLSGMPVPGSLPVEYRTRPQPVYSDGMQSYPLSAPSMPVLGPLPATQRNGVPQGVPRVGLQTQYFSGYQMVQYQQSGPTIPAPMPGHMLPSMMPGPSYQLPLQMQQMPPIHQPPTLVPAPPLVVPAQLPQQHALSRGGMFGSSQPDSHHTAGNGPAPMDRDDGFQFR